MDKNFKLEKEKLYILSEKVKACFKWFFIWAILNFSFLFWTSKWWIDIRIIINYFLRPFLWYIVWWHLTEIYKNKQEKEGKESLLKIKKLLNYIAIVIIVLFTILLAWLHINYERDKIYCKDEITKENYFSCIDEAKHNILNIPRIFHD